MTSQKIIVVLKSESGGLKQVELKTFCRDVQNLEKNLKKRAKIENRGIFR
jgi:hypothetical protein